MVQQGGPCTSDSQCDTSANYICDPDAHTCECPNGDTVNEFNVCVGSYCPTNPCTVLHTTCVNGHCQCTPFWVWNTHQTSCQCSTPFYTNSLGNCGMNFYFYLSGYRFLYQRKILFNKKECVIYFLKIHNTFFG